jgi:hypothetical protein
VFPNRKSAIEIVFSDGRIIHAPRNYPFEAIAESLLDNVYARFGFDGNTIVDVGSSIGVFVVSQSKKTSRWFVFEPDAEIFPWLALNVRTNHLENSVVAYNSPVSSKEMALICDKVGQIDFLKIDCEGCEYGLLNWPELLFKRIHKIAAEVHLIGDKEPSKISSFLLQRNFEIQMVPGRGNTSYLYATRKTNQEGGQGNLG